jgi:hypothetical protein
MNPLTRFQSMLPKKEQQKIEKLKTPWRTVYIKILQAQINPIDHQVNGKTIEPCP